MAPKRIAIWSHPRSLSTALVMSLGNYGKVEVFNEFYGGAYAFGPEKKVSSPPPLPIPPEKDLTYDAVKALLETDYPDQELIIFKDHAAALDKKYDKLPQGFVHTFIIRDPTKMFLSNQKMAEKSGMTIEMFIKFSETMFGKSHGYEAMVDLVKYIEETLKQKVVIVDADDLQSNPKNVLGTFCKAVDIPFRDTLLSWKPIAEIPWHIPKALLAFNKATGAYESALKSTGWLPPDPNTVDLTNIPKVLFDAIEVALPFYETLHAKRLNWT
ncbi:branched-chain-amino-acid aminotransferase-like protein 2 [Asterias rubens]|uniref:branched-chain-amino-acid aminotransferase-like protein 2 n=1 Tax=Asterias rubens TaxID=7604 RepID=UPI001455D491|nr:branched-chain-amino-acid aminotransferase-like protein 2 [Asterias rubens]XP_033626586.1 branched-chain-amino-acid aminotransferase-like protein 2 [Asterias rubens]